MYIGKKVKRILPLDKSELERFKEVAPRQYQILVLQEMQIEAINKAEEQYENDCDYEKITSFWELIFQNGGLAFDSMSWTFRLVDLYISGKRYNDALRILDMVKGNIYQKKVNQYRERIYKKLSK